jgi:hypothetical protein
MTSEASDPILESSPSVRIKKKRRTKNASHPPCQSQLTFEGSNPFIKHRLASLNTLFHARNSSASPTKPAGPEVV